MSVAAANIKSEDNMGAEWVSLGTPASELRLEHTLPTGQSFRWVKAGDDGYIGVVGQRVVEMRQQDNDVVYRILARGPDALPSQDNAALADYFNLSTCLTDLSATWCAADERFKSLSAVLPGARMLRQDPVECLFSFICSSNNHISRIHGMVTKLTRYGTLLPPPSSQAIKHEDVSLKSSVEAAEFYAFPSLEQLQAATEEDLRAAGFGYRAKFIVGSVAELFNKPEGGEAWLLSLRERSFVEACEALCTLPGVGPKVAACVALFSLDKHDAIPVDTHVWQLATKYYAKHLRGKTNSPKLHDQVQAAFVERFGPYAGWAHNTLFISELAHVKKKVAAQAEYDDEDSSSDEDGTGSESDFEVEAFGTAQRKNKKKEIEKKGGDVAALKDAPVTPAVETEGGAGGRTSGRKKRRT